ncbi:MAG: hypothetical protein HXY20_05815 [Acidobacteria bacterium]|nr:hypothetical protein [Acidobacteriota bacterium]
MNRESMYRPALIGGVALGVLSALPVIGAFNCACCAWVIGGGMLAAHLYVKDSPTAVTLGNGVLLGLITGLIGAFVDTVFSIPLHMAMSGVGMGVAEYLREMAEEIPNMPPEARDVLRSLAASGVGIGSVFFFIAALLKFFIYGIVAMLGGVLGVALFEKRTPGSRIPAEMSAYQPPPGAPPGS